MLTFILKYFDQRYYVCLQSNTIHNGIKNYYFGSDVFLIDWLNFIFCLNNNKNSTISSYKTQKPGILKTEIQLLNENMTFLIYYVHGDIDETLYKRSDIINSQIFDRLVQNLQNKY